MECMQLAQVLGNVSCVASYNWESTATKEEAVGLVARYACFEQSMRLPISRPGAVLNVFSFTHSTLPFSHIK